MKVFGLKASFKKKKEKHEETKDKKICCPKMKQCIKINKCIKGENN